MKPTKSLLPTPSTTAFFVVMLVICLGLIGSYLVVFATNWGPWAHTDSVGYFEVAHNWSLGRGPVLIRADGSAHLTYLQPPLYPLVWGSIAAIVRVFNSAMTLITVARWLDVALFFGFILMTGLLSYWLTRSVILPLSLSLVIVSSVVMLIDFTGAMSEPLFFCTGFAGLFCLLVYWLKYPFRWLWLLSALLTGAAFMTRYSGVVFIAAGAAGILLFSPQVKLNLSPGLRGLVQGFRARALPAVSYALLGLAPFLLWTLYLRLKGETPGLYELVLATVGSDLKQVLQAVTETIWRWIPYSGYFRFSTAGKVLTLSGAALILAALGYAARNGQQLPSHSRQAAKAGQPASQEIAAQSNALFLLGAVFGLFCLLYIAFIALTYVIVDFPKPALIDRIFSPIQTAGFLAAAALFLCVFQAPPIRLGRVFRAGFMAKIFFGMRFLPLIAALLFLKLNWVPIQENLQQAHLYGSGYTSASWQQSPVIAALRQLPPDTPIISTDPDVVLFFLSRPAYPTRILFDPLAAAPGAGIEQRFEPSAQGQALLRQDGAALVIFQSAAQDSYNPSLSSLRTVAQGLHRYFEGDDGTIYLYQEP